MLTLNKELTVSEKTAYSDGYLDDDSLVTRLLSTARKLNEMVN